jgi:hypothetical protein
MYLKPEVTRYSGTELLDLMGPVETAYCELEPREPPAPWCDVDTYWRLSYEGFTTREIEDARVYWEMSGPGCGTETGVCDGETEEGCEKIFAGEKGNSESPIDIDTNPPCEILECDPLPDEIHFEVRIVADGEEAVCDSYIRIATNEEP